MEKLVLKTELREKNEDLASLRLSKVVPAVVYGHKQESLSIKMDNSDFLRVFRVAGKNHVVALEVSGKKIDALVHDVQFHPVSGAFIHVDFYAITKGEKVHTQIPLVFIGVSRARAEESAVIEENLKEIEVKCLPTDLVDSFEVNLSFLEKTGDSIKVWDLNIPEKFEVLNAHDEVVAHASKSKVEKETTDEVDAEATTEEK